MTLFNIFHYSQNLHLMINTVIRENCLPDLQTIFYNEKHFFYKKQITLSFYKKIIEFTRYEV